MMGLRLTRILEGWEGTINSRFASSELAPVLQGVANNAPIIFQCLLSLFSVTLKIVQNKGKNRGYFNPLSPNSDQHQISPCNINVYSTPEVMRIKDMITQGEFSGYFNNFSPVRL